MIACRYVFFLFPLPVPGWLYRGFHFFWWRVAVPRGDSYFSTPSRPRFAFLFRSTPCSPVPVADPKKQAMINLKISSKSSDSYFFNAGGFPGVAMNASSGKEVVVEDPWSTAYGGSAAAPFDQGQCFFFSDKI